jgi:hypothetical protein
MLATKYANIFGIDPQRDGENDSDFRGRVAGILRDKGELIYANEAYYDKRIDYSGGDVMTGVLGAVAQAMQGVDYGEKGERQLGVDFAAGVVSQAPKEDPMALLLAIMLSGK